MSNSKLSNLLELNAIHLSKLLYPGTNFKCSSIVYLKTLEIENQGFSLLENTLLDLARIKVGFLNPNYVGVSVQEPIYQKAVDDICEFLEIETVDISSALLTSFVTEATLLNSSFTDININYEAITRKWSKAFK